MPRKRRLLLDAKGNPAGPSYCYTVVRIAEVLVDSYYSFPPRPLSIAVAAAKAVQEVLNPPAGKSAQ